MLRLLALALTLQDPAAADLMRQATFARAEGTLESLSERWAAEAAADPEDDLAALGAAYAHYLRYDLDGAETRFGDVLARSGLPPAVAGWAAYGAAHLDLGRARYDPAGDRFARSEAIGVEIADSSLVALSRAGRAEVAIRTESIGPALALYDQAAAWAVEGTRAHSAVLCSRAAYDASVTTVELRRAADRAGVLGDPQIAGRCFFVIALRYIQRGESDSVAVYVRSAIERLEGARDLYGLSTALQWAGYYERLVGDYASAEDRLHRSIDVGRRSGNDAAVAWALINLAAIAGSLGDVANGITWARDARALLETQGDQFGLATVQGLEGDLWRVARDTTRARVAYMDALEAARRLGQIGTILADEQALGTLALDRGDLEEAQLRFERVQEMVRDNGLVGWEGSAALDLADLAARRGDLLRADSIYHAVQPGERQATPEAQLLTRMAGVRARLGAVDSALALASNAAEMLDRWRTETVDERLRLYALQRDAGDQGLATAVSVLARSGRAVEAFTLSDRRRARELLDQMVRERTMAGRELNERTTAVAGLDRVREALPDGLALLTYTAAGWEPTTIFLVTRDSVWVDVTVPVDSVRADVGRLRSLAEVGAPTRAVARRLADALLPESLAELPDEVERLAIVPEGVIHAVVFDLLPLPSGGTVVDRFAVSSVPSAAVARDLWGRTPSAAPASMLVMGDPDPPDSATGPAFARTGGLPRLPGAAREARAVSRYAREPVVRLGSEATEAHLRSADLTDVSVLHLATHAFVDEQTSTRTALALAPGDGEDGYVSPADLAELELSGALVVLSACRSGGGELVRGEGLQGLSAPLLRAGAASVLATRWRVDDASIAPFVERIYARLAEGEAVDQALRGAKLAARADGVGSGTWAAFTLVGDGSRDFELRRPGGWAVLREATGLTVGLASVAACLVLLSLWFRRERSIRARDSRRP